MKNNKLGKSSKNKAFLDDEYDYLFNREQSRTLLDDVYEKLGRDKGIDCICGRKEE